MEKAKKLNVIGQLLLLSAAMAWGTSFFILKETISQVPTFYVIAIRFAVAGVGLALIFFKRFKKISKATFFRGLVLGLFLACAYFSQTVGLKLTTPGRNAFLSASYCVMCPFIIWLLFKKRPKLYNVVSAVMCIVGIGFIALSGNSGGGDLVLLGDGLTLVSAVFFGLQIIYIDKFSSEGHDPIQMLVAEILTVGAIMTVYTLAIELPINGGLAFKLNLDQILKIGYLTLVCTLYTQMVQIIGQRYASANQSSIILSLESVFGTAFSVLFADEKLSVLIVLGFIIVFFAMLVSELKIDPRKLILRKRINNFDTKMQNNDLSDGLENKNNEG